VGAKPNDHLGRSPAIPASTTSTTGPTPGKCKPEHPDKENNQGENPQCVHGEPDRAEQ
jgi:hypothetical protein